MIFFAPADESVAPKLTPAQARAALADEWNAREPETQDEIAEFYRTSEHLEGDLEAFHTSPDRQKWSEVLVHLAKNVVQSKVAVDIGSGLGNDLFALRQTGVETVIGVEPNDRLRMRCSDVGFQMHADVADAPIEDADLLSCFDVLEHVVDPEAFLGGIAERAKVGTILVETCATSDVGTPLHLKANRGWHPGRCMELHGWERVGDADRLRVWRRESLLPKQSTGLIVCAYRGISLQTMHCILKLIDKPPTPDPFAWRVHLSGEAGINRARSIMASRWYREMNDDVFLMLDDDITFQAEDADKIVTKCREGYDVICAAYPVRDGGHLAIRGMDQSSLSFHADAEPVEIKYAATGFLAIHRRVLDALIPTLPLCHANQTWGFWPLFDFKVVEDEVTGGYNYLSEDWNFSEMARAAGFKSWLDPSIKLGHLGQVEFNVSNMTSIFKAVTGKTPDTTTEILDGSKT